MGKPEKEDTGFSRSGNILAVGACVLTEEHHVIFHINQTVVIMLQDFAPTGGRKKVKRGKEAEVEENMKRRK